MCSTTKQHPCTDGLILSGLTLPVTCANRVVNRLFQPMPVAVLYAHSSQEVASALQCATLNNIPITVAAGRHGYLGSAVLNGYFTVDVSNLTQFIVSPDNSTIRVGAGMKNGLFVHNLKKTGIPGVAGIVGNCPSVGMSGTRMAVKNANPIYKAPSIIRLHVCRWLWLPDHHVWPGL